MVRTTSKVLNITLTSELDPLMQAWATVTLKAMFIFKKFKFEYVYNFLTQTHRVKEFSLLNYFFKDPTKIKIAFFGFQYEYVCLIDICKPVCSKTLTKFTLRKHKHLNLTFSNTNDINFMTSFCTFSFSSDTRL